MDTVGYVLAKLGDLSAEDVIKAHIRNADANHGRTLISIDSQAPDKENWDKIKYAVFVNHSKTACLIGMVHNLGKKPDNPPSGWTAGSDPRYTQPQEWEPDDMPTWFELDLINGADLGQFIAESGKPLAQSLTGGCGLVYATRTTH